MNSSLPPWIERLLGIETAESGEGTAYTLNSAWSWAPWITVLFVLFVVGFVVWNYAREGGEAGPKLRTLLGGIRLSLFAILLFMIAEVVLSLERTGLPYVVVLVDDSASMGVADRYEDERERAAFESRAQGVGAEEPTRLNLAKSVLLEDNAALLRGVDRDYKLKLYTVSTAARQQPGTVQEIEAAVRHLEPTGESTRLGDGIQSVLADLRGTPPAAMVLLTDGINTDGESLAAAALVCRRKGVPLYSVALGSDRPVRDIELSDLLVDEVVFVNDIVNFEFKLTATGLQGRQVEVRLREKNGSEPLARLPVTLGGDGEPQRVRLPYRPTEVGEFEYVVEVDVLDGEAHDHNNARERVVSVRKEQIRVLFVQSYPNFEFRYLKHMLERDGTIELHTLLQESDPEYAAQDRTALRTFPARRDELFAYDVIIFGDVDPAFLSGSMLGDVSAFVSEKGGGVVFIAGPLFTPGEYRGTPIDPLLPVDLSSTGNVFVAQSSDEGFQVAPTDLGLASPQMQLGDTPAETESIWKNLPRLYGLYEMAALKPAARVLAEHPTRLAADGTPLPILAMQFVGAGKVLFHATDDTWRWRFQVGDVYFARYWVQTIRYLSRSKLLGKDRSAELTTDRREYQQGEVVRLRVRFVDERLAPANDEGVSVVLEQEGRQKRPIQLRRNASNRGIFEGTFSRPVAGSYHAWVAEPTLEGQAPATDFVVVAPPGEFEQVRTDRAELERAAEQTEGRTYDLHTARRLVDDLPRGRQIPIESLPPVSLWNRWPLLALFLALISGEWLLRKHQGLM
ncbi:MAG: VWA domain-containing protein [Pirellulales bacterium]|nr:VWA domain-containing protein [Pirellulales bacterium]